MVNGNQISTPTPTPGSKTLDSGLRVLTAIAAAPSGVKVSALSRELGLHRTVVYRLLLTLAAHGLVTHAQDGSYHLGPAAARLADAGRTGLRVAAREPLQQLARLTAATAHLTVLEGAEAVSLLVVEPTEAMMHVAYRVGTRHPLDRGAAGMAILLGGQPLRGERAAVRRARLVGYVASKDELQAGAWGLAAPIPVEPGLHSTASVGVIALQTLDEQQVGQQVLHAAAEISRRMIG